MKNVYLLFRGVIIEHFQCKAADICGRSVVFHGIPQKDGKEATFRIHDDLIHDVDHFKRVARVYGTNPDHEIIVTW